MENEPILSKLEQALLTAMQALDTQVAREMQRSPVEREAHGVQKWEPFQKRIELLTSFILNSLGEEAIQLDSVLILAQALTQALRMATEDSGEDGLGTIRSAYCLTAAEVLSREAQFISKQLKHQQTFS